MRRPGSNSDPLWYKDAIIYELHVRSFFDSTDDGTGDFPGLTRKLDYLQDLGITCLWLLPFYPSPLRDDGYDIARYDAVHPAYGTVRDFRHFLREAHARKIQVITELVINHTSDQHPWFQAARRAPRGSSKRDFYVWSDANRKYEEARVIFTDTETSNWTWDHEAQAYYWHRFFHHQPDLNFDNAHVRRAVLRVMRFWFDIGVDGMRLDAVPYLIEREGTNCENLPETHAILRELRHELDERYGNRVLLAEANQWPADVRLYMGEGDECQMAFHFPLMPRIFMALRQEDRHPITEILDQTPEIPEVCQWALFLRNHDELTLEMVTDEERDYMYRAYGADPQMRLNVGIRRRLAPLMENSRPRIHLLNSLLFSLPGTPIVYYGDEIGMGDNIYLGDRNGVRTPMQWTGDRNAGFSRADPARLFAPPIMDPVYGYQAINVEAQQRSPYSLLNWMKRMIALRKEHRTFGRGAIRFLPVSNRRILAYVRSDEQETILAVANLARTVQPAELDLTDYRGLVPIEMLGRTEFPRIGDLPYFLTLGPHSFYWFQLATSAPPISARIVEPPPAETVEVTPALLTGSAWETMLDGPVRRLLERDYLVAYVQRQRWFGGKARGIRSAVIADWGLLRQGPNPRFFTLVDVTDENGTRERYSLTMAMESGVAAELLLRDAPESVIARVKGARAGVLHDARGGAEAAAELIQVIVGNARIRMRHGQLAGNRTGAWPADTAPTTVADFPVRPAGTDQSNSSFVCGDRWILKLIRRLEAGPNPDVEIQRHLGERIRFAAVPAFLGSLRYEDGQAAATDVGMLQAYVAAQATGWEHAVDEVRRFLDRETALAVEPSDAQPHLEVFVQAAPPSIPCSVLDTVGGYLETATRLGERTAELHLALADARDPSFAPEPLGPSDLAALGAKAAREADETLTQLAGGLDVLAQAERTQAEAALAARSAFTSVFNRLPAASSAGARIRVHGDFHLGQILWSSGDIVFLDFEGEPMRPLEERRARQSPLRDVAGMMRSFTYAAGGGLMAEASGQAERDRLWPRARIWQTWVAGTFLHAYRRTIGSGLVPEDAGVFLVLLRAFLLDKALYEVRYEMSHRPDWIGIPLAGLVDLAGGEMDP